MSSAGAAVRSGTTGFSSTSASVEWMWLVALSHGEVLMKKFRITVQHNPRDPADDLRVAAQVRRDLWAHSPVEIEPDSSRHGTHRDSDRNAYFEFATKYPEEVSKILAKYHSRVRTEIVTEQAGPECANCGNVAGPVLPTVCPNCRFRDIAACPYCSHGVPRQNYLPITGDLFECPDCSGRVRLRMNDPMFNSQGNYNEPLVVVEPVEAALHAVR